jgi:hypothetical protein
MLGRAIYLPGSGDCTGYFVLGVEPMGILTSEYTNVHDKRSRLFISNSYMLVRGLPPPASKVAVISCATVLSKPGSR